MTEKSESQIDQHTVKEGSHLVGVTFHESMLSQKEEVLSWPRHRQPSCSESSSSTDSTEITQGHSPTDSIHAEQTSDSDIDKRGSPAACIFVASLTKEKNDEQLNVSVSNHFMQWGDLLNVKVLKDWMDRPYAFVQYERMSDAKKALREAPGTVLDGRNIRCEPARVNRTLCLAPLDNTWLSEKKIQGKLTRFGEIEDITLTKSNSQAQCAFVKFRYRDDAIKAFLSLRASQASSHWCVEWASNLESSLPDPAVCRTDKLSVFIGNLPETVTESAIYSRFGHYGNIVHLRMHRKTDTRAGKRVFAFVRYTNKQEAAKAIEHENGAVWVGRPIRVAYREYHEPLSSLPSHSPYMERPHPPGMGFPASIYQYQMATGNKEDESKATETGCYFQPPIISQQVGSTSREPLSIYYDTTAYMPFTSMTDMAYPYNKYQDCPVYPYYPMPVYSPPHDQFSAYYDNPYYTSMYYVYPPLVPSPPPPPITSTTWRPKLSDNHHRKMEHSRTKGQPEEKEDHHDSPD